MADERMTNVPIKMTAEEIDYINQQKPNRCAFVRRLIDQHMDMAGLLAVAEGLRLERVARREEVAGDAV